MAIEQMLDNYRDRSIDQQAALLQELIMIELELRRHHGDQPSLREYAIRFPECFGDLGQLLKESESASQRLSTADLTLAPNLFIPGYHVFQNLGSGGSGTVFRAWDVKAKKQVVLKVRSTNGTEKQFEYDELVHEAAILSRFRHPNISQTLALLEQESQYILVSQYIAGRCLSDAYPDGVIDVRDAAKIVSQIARTVGFLHEQGIAHLDLAPRNIICRSGSPEFVLIDFGLARSISFFSPLIEPGFPFGTPRYMSPEQAAGSRQRTGPWSDVYSLGAIFYFLLSGARPMDGLSEDDAIEETVHGRTIDLGKIELSCPIELIEIVRRCSERDPAMRYRDANELCIELDRFLGGQSEVPLKAA
ncbi:serine/threonine protein kinase [Roseiconus lacunae]|uniref:serine/threonine protein kinase n=1 Tax=Roseiconus lacunae TaxID=2605694 RepID=UPI001E59BFCC|nr:serine/threonine-protein kinase [Roseiconus lacunae]